MTIACLDVHYSHDSANAAAIVIEDWRSQTPMSEATARVRQSARYQAGRFYLRELQPLLAVIDRIAEPIDVYVIDAYCYLSSDRAPGLGAYLHAALASTAVIVGVAKSRFRDTDHAVEVLRGRSVRPLFVTAIGLDEDVAAAQVASMAGEYRIPAMIKAADRLARRSS